MLNILIFMFKFFSVKFRFYLFNIEITDFSVISDLLMLVFFLSFCFVVFDVLVFLLIRKYRNFN